jgi:6-phosphogluconolactonase
MSQRAISESPLRQHESKVIVAEDKTAAVVQAAHLFVQTLGEAARQQERISVALSGGNTPRSLFQLLSEKSGPFFLQIPWQKIHFFWGDERCVPANDPESNFRMAKEALLDKVPIEAGKFHRVITEGRTPEESAQAYQRELQMFFQKTTLSSPPRFDLVLLGMGTNGHTASLFPDSPLEELEKGPYDECWVKSFYVPHLNTMRISFTPRLINAAGTVVFLVTGKNKSKAFHEVMGSDLSPLKLPSKLIAPSSGQLYWIVDRDTANE